MFKRSIPAPTPEQQTRQDRARAIGCIACRLFGTQGQAGVSEIHHQTRTGRQIGQDATVCLCSWHHRGICFENYSSNQMLLIYGPSLAKGSKPFYKTFGSNEEQLEFQNELIEKANARFPWHEG